MIGVSRQHISNLFPSGSSKKNALIARTVISTDFRPLQILSAGLSHRFRNPIDFLSRIRPERNARVVRLMILVLCKSEELRRLVGASRIKLMEIFAGSRRWRRFVFLENEPELRQKTSVKLCRCFHIAHSQVDVVERSFLICSTFDFLFESSTLIPTRYRRARRL